VISYKYILVHDGTRSAPSDDVALLPFFSPDSNHLCHAVLLNGKVRVYLDGKPGKEYDGVVPTWACFSPDSKHLAYGALRDGKLVLVVDGEEIAAYEKPFGTLLFEDSQHLSGVALRFSNSQFAEEIVRIEADVAID